MNGCSTAKTAAALFTRQLLVTTTLIGKGYHKEKNIFTTINECNNKHENALIRALASYTFIF